MTINHSKWNVSPDGRLNWQGHRRSAGIFNIVILDDHPLYSDTVRSMCITPFFPNANVYEFREGYEACRFLKQAMDENIPIDLLITDHNHPGMDGAMLVMNVRAYEEKLKIRQRIPILMLTMMSPAFIRNREEFPYFRIDKYLSKSSCSDEIIDALEELLFRKKKWLLECYIAGFQYYEGGSLLSLMRRGTRILLQREKDNAHDRRAVALYLKDRKIGYIPAGKNVVIASILDGERNPLFAEILEVNADGSDWAKVKIGVGL